MASSISNSLNAYAPKSGFLASSFVKPRATGYNPSLAASLAGGVGYGSSTPKKSVDQPVKKVAPPAAPASGAGTYWGTPINTSGDVAAQVRAVDTQRKGLVPPPGAPAKEDRKSKGNTPSKNENGPAASPLSFPGAVGDLSAASRQSPTQAGLIQRTAQSGDSARAIGDRALALSEKYGAEIARVGQLGAGAVAGGLSTGTNVVGSGNAAIASQSASSRMSALSQAQQAALEGTGQQLTAQSQQASALTQALGGANTGQSNTISGLGAAAGLGQPQVAGVGQTSFNPLTGQYAQGVGGFAPEVMQQYAQMAANGQYAAIPSFVTGNPVLNAQLNEAAKAINPSYTPLGSQAQGAAFQSNITTSGTAGTDIARSGLQGATMEYQDMSAINSAADAQASQVQSVLAASGLNQGAPAFTKALNTLGGQLGDAKVTELQTAVTELQNIYSQLLNTGGTTPTGSEEQALAILSPYSTPEQIDAAIRQLQAAAYNKLQASYGKVQSYQSNLGGGASPAPSAGGQQTSGGSSLYDF